ncbi:MAG: aspartate kinase [Micrococcaceae bacterium]
MALIVQKFGGSSVADAEGIKRVANRIIKTKKAGNEVIAVVSAMGDTTDELLDLVNEVTTSHPSRELDMLLTAGERISMALLAMAINDKGQKAQSFTGSQAGMITDGSHGEAKIIDVDPYRLRKSLKQDNIPIVAGFQGVSRRTKDITTLGRGGSDTTAVAISAAMEADVCEIYTDVDGVFTADPRIVPSAHKINEITSEEMLELAASGAKVLHLRSVEYARRFGVKLHVRSSFSKHEGTWVIPNGPKLDIHEEGVPLEQPIISGVAHDTSESKITVIGLPNGPGKAAQIFHVISEAKGNIDMIVHDSIATNAPTTDLSFTLPTSDREAMVKALEAKQDEIGFEDINYNDEIGKLSLVGAGMRSHPGVSADFFQTLSDNDINIDMISTSEIRISITIAEKDLKKAVSVIHTAFGLDDDKEAVVYGGTGR